MTEKRREAIPGLEVVNIPQTPHQTAVSHFNAQDQTGRAVRAMEANEQTGKYSICIDASFLDPKNRPPLEETKKRTRELNPEYYLAILSRKVETI